MECEFHGFTVDKICIYCRHMEVSKELAAARAENENLKADRQMWVGKANDFKEKWESLLEQFDIQVDEKLIQVSENERLRHALKPLAYATRASYAFADSSSDPFVVSEQDVIKAKEILKGD